MLRGLAAFLFSSNNASTDNNNNDTSANNKSKSGNNRNNVITTTATVDDNRDKVILNQNENPNTTVFTELFNSPSSPSLMFESLHPNYSSSIDIDLSFPANLESSNGAHRKLMASLSSSSSSLVSLYNHNIDNDSENPQFYAKSISLMGVDDNLRLEDDWLIVEHVNAHEGNINLVNMSQDVEELQSLSVGNKLDHQQSVEQQNRQVQQQEPQQQLQQQQKNSNKCLEVSTMSSNSSVPRGDCNAIQSVHKISSLSYLSKPLSKSNKKSTLNTDVLKKVKKPKTMKYHEDISFTPSKKEPIDQIAQNYAEEIILEEIDGKLIEDSWFMTPLPCFSTIAPVNVETSPFENLLIEHPSMSVYYGLKSPTEIIDCFQKFRNNKPNTGNCQVSDDSKKLSCARPRPKIATNRASRNIRMETQTVVQLKEEKLSRKMQRVRIRKDQENCCRGQLKRSNKVHDFHAQCYPQKRCDRQHFRVLSRANNNRKCAT